MTISYTFFLTFQPNLDFLFHQHQHVFQYNNLNYRFHLKENIFAFVALRYFHDVLLSWCDESDFFSSKPPLLVDERGTNRVIWKWGFEFLGAPIGTHDFCNNHSADRAKQAEKLLAEISELDDPQVGLRLMCSCAGFLGDPASSLTPK